MTSEKKILFLGKKNDVHCAKALQFCKDNFSVVYDYLGDWGEALPQEIYNLEIDLIVSYLSRWVVPEELIAKAKFAAINFHPASPDYPGIGCNNFALYENAKEYGATCHYMLKKVDTGKIIKTIFFPVYAEDSVETLLARTYEYMLTLFYDVIGQVIKNNILPVSDEKWSRKPFTRQEFNELRKVSPEMSKEEIEKRTRATLFNMYKPYLVIQGYVFELKVD